MTTKAAKNKSTESVDEPKGCQCKASNCASKTCGCIKRKTKCSDEICKCISKTCKNRVSTKVQKNTVKFTVNDAEESKKTEKTKKKITAKEKLTKFKSPDEDSVNSLVKPEDEEKSKRKTRTEKKAVVIRSEKNSEELDNMSKKTASSRKLRRSYSVNDLEQAVAYNTRSRSKTKKTAQGNSNGKTMSPSTRGLRKSVSTAALDKMREASVSASVSTKMAPKKSTKENKTEQKTRKKDSSNFPLKNVNVKAKKKELVLEGNPKRKDKSPNPTKSKKMNLIKVPATLNATSPVQNIEKLPNMRRSVSMNDVDQNSTKTSTLNRKAIKQRLVENEAIPSTSRNHQNSAVTETYSQMETRRTLKTKMAPKKSTNENQTEQKTRKKHSSNIPLKNVNSKTKKEELVSEGNPKRKDESPNPTKSKKMNFLKVPASLNATSPVENIEKLPNMRRSHSMNDVDKISTLDREAIQQRLVESEGIPSTSRNHQNFEYIEFSDDENLSSSREFENYERILSSTVAEPTGSSSEWEDT